MEDKISDIVILDCKTDYILAPSLRAKQRMRSGSSCASQSNTSILPVAMLCRGKSTSTISKISLLPPGPGILLIFPSKTLEKSNDLAYDVQFKACYYHFFTI